MNRAYQIHIERIQAHDLQHQNTSLAYTVLQALDPDLSCQLCYPGTNYHRTYRTFWNWYRKEYSAKSYSQQTISAHLELTHSSSYNQARAAARDIAFSCRYNTPLDNPKNIIQILLNKYTRYTLLPHLPLDFEVTSFDTYIEFQTNPTTNNPYLNRTPEEALGTLGSPIPNQYQSSLDHFEFSSIASENLIDQDQNITSENFSPPSLTPYNEDTTQINFPPLDRNQTPSPPLVNISLTPPIQTPDFQIFPSTPSTNTSN